MKTLCNIFFTMVFGALLHQSIIAGNLEVSGNLVKEETITVNDPPLVVKDCNGNVVNTIAGAQRSNTKRTPYTNTGQTVTFTISRQGMTTFDLTSNMNSINYNTSNGAFSTTLSDGRLVESRYNYTVKVKVGSDAYVSEREYTISPSGAVFPIGSVIAYMGNSSTIAALRESGWFKCNGATIDTISALTADERTALKDIIGNNLPDLRSSFLRGLDEGRGWDDDAASRTGGEGGNGVRSSQGESMRKHRHSGSGTTSTNGTHNHGLMMVNGDDLNWSNQPGQHPTGDAVVDNVGNEHLIYTTNSGNHDHSYSFTTSDPINASDGTAHVSGNETRPDNYAVYWLIRGR